MIDLQKTAISAGIISWKKFCGLYPQLNKYQMPDIIINRRLKKTGGRCFDFQNKIDLSHNLMENNIDEYINVIIPHELAHQINYNLNGPKCGNHSRSWKQIMVKYGLPPEIYHRMET